MKKQFLFASLAVVLSGTAFAQASTHAISPAPAVALPSSNSAMTVQTTGCGPDASDYVFFKGDTVAVANANTFYFLDMWPGELASTAYALNYPATITGVLFVARVKPGSVSPITVEVSVANLASGYQPNLTPLSTATVSVTSTANFYQALFPTGVNVTDSFAVIIRNTDTGDTLQAIISDFAEPAIQEGLSWYNYQGIWEDMQTVYAIDAEFRILPIYTYNITTDFTTANDSVCAGSAVNFTNTSSNIFGNRMFNMHAFDTYFLSEVDSTFAWDFGDATPVVYGQAPSHTYATAGTYTISVTGRMVGGIADCQDTKTMTMVVMPQVVPAFSVNSSLEPLISFDATGTTGATSYSWNFGDSNTGAGQATAHTYTANGSYVVTLTATGFCGTAVSTQTVTITALGINATGEQDVKAFYNPQAEALNLVLPAGDAAVTIYDMLGNVVYTSNTTAANPSIAMNGFAAGTYMVRVETATGVSTIKFAVTR